MNEFSLFPLMQMSESESIKDIFADLPFHTDVNDHTERNEAERTFILGKLQLSCTSWISLHL